MDHRAAAANHAGIAAATIEQGEAHAEVHSTSGGVATMIYAKAQVHATLAVAHGLAELAGSRPSTILDSVARSLAAARPGDAIDPWRDAKAKGFVEPIKPRVLVRVKDGEVMDVSIAADVDIDVLVVSPEGQDMYRLSAEGDPAEVQAVHETFNTSGGLRA